MQHGFRLSAILVRLILIGVWAGIVFLGGIAYAQEKNIDTLHILQVHIDTLRLGFEDVLQLSVQYDSVDKDDWRYLYRWNTGERTDAVRVKFEGKRKLLYIGQRFSAIHWPEEYDTFFAAKEHIWYATDPEEDTCVVCVPTLDAGTYVWHTHARTNGKLHVLGREQCIYVYPAIRAEFLRGFDRRPVEIDLYCSPKVVSEGEGLTDPSLHLDFDTVSGIKQRMQGAVQRHDLNVWDMPRGMQVYARLGDTLHFFSRLNPALYPEHEDQEFVNAIWFVYPDNIHFNYIEDSAVDICFKDSIFLRKVRYGIRADMNTGELPKASYLYVYFGIKPNAKIETDSVWVFFPQYPYSNLGGRMDVCLSHDAPLPSADDTVHTFNLGPWNRELEYVEYAWFDGTKDILGADSVMGRDSVFHYTFGKMDSVAPDLYAGRVVTHVAADSLWQDSCGCFVPCMEEACSGYDTVKIYLHRLPLRERNFFLPQNEILCAHQDLELFLPQADDYRCFWLDRDSVALPYGHDTARYTVEGMRGLDGYGEGTDTREPRLLQLRLDHKFCGVSYFDTLLVYDQVKPDFELLCHDTLICLDEPVEIDSLSLHVYSPFYVFEWNDGTKGSGYTFTAPGLYTLRFFVGKDFAVCGYDTAVDTIRVRWSDPAQTRITLSDTSFCEKISSSVILDASVPCSSTRYSWQEGPLPDPEEDFWEEDSIVFTSPVIKVEGEITLSLFLVDTMNCVNARQIEVTENDCSPKLEIPNVFTPNGDGVNDVWRFKQLEYCTDVKVEVVDRWGQPVLKTKVATAADFEWNGRVNNTGARLPDGPYFYMVTYKNLYGKSKVQSGSITILGTAE